MKSVGGGTEFNFVVFIPLPSSFDIVGVYITTTYLHVHPRLFYLLHQCTSCTYYPEESSRSQVKSSQAASTHYRKSKTLFSRRRRRRAKRKLNFVHTCTTLQQQQQPSSSLLSACFQIRLASRRSQLKCQDVIKAELNLTTCSMQFEDWYYTSSNIAKLELFSDGMPAVPNRTFYRHAALVWSDLSKQSINE